MIKRTISEYLRSCVKEYFSVCIFGPRQCGKTTLVQNLFLDYSYANLEDMNTRILAKEDPNEFFTRFPEPVIIDEIQRVPELLSTVQVRIDKFKKKGQYIITGSQQIPLKNTVSQSLAGRVAIVQMQPFSLEELKQNGMAPLSTQSTIGTSVHPQKSRLTLAATSSMACIILSFLMKGLKVLSCKVIFSDIRGNN